MPLVRAALYLCVSGLLGSALLWSSDGRAPGRLGRAWLLACAAAGAPLSVWGLWLQVGAMNGAPPSPALVWSVARDLPVGHAAAVRVIASAAALMLTFRGRLSARPPLFFARRRERALLLTAALGAVAAASLAWGGHGAAGEGAAGLVALAADIVHLLAAAYWIGAIGALGLMAREAETLAPDRVSRLRQAMAAFAGPGAAAVCILAFTGLFNAWRLVGPEHVGALLATPYGGLLGLKLLLFAAMLGLAAVNRWRRTPALARATAARADARAALRAARLGLVLEFACGLGVLLAVGWLGLLPPPGET